MTAPRLFPDFCEMTVTGVEDLTPHMRRLTLTGRDLTRFASQADLHVRLFFAPSGSPPSWPVRGPDGLLVPIDPESKPAVRKYTIRRIDLARSLVEIDLVLHNDAGPGSTFAAQARPGDMLGMAGPGGRTARPAEWMLLAGDETALPAIARIAEHLPPATGGEIVIEVENIFDRIDIRAPNGMTIRWLTRDGRASVLADAVRTIKIPQRCLRFLWAGAEFATIQAIRRHWRDDCQIAKHDQLTVPYWRRGEVTR